MRRSSCAALGIGRRIDRAGRGRLAGTGGGVPRWEPGAGRVEAAGGVSKLGAIMRWPSTSAALLASMAVLLLATTTLSSCGEALLTSASFDSTPSVPLTRDLPRLIVAKSPAFDQRIRSSFPVGSPGNPLVKTLTKNGFERHPPNSVADDEHQASRTEFGMPCRWDRATHCEPSNADCEGCRRTRAGAMTARDQASALAAAPRAA